jgi:signal transduction histidine kinase
VRGGLEFLAKADKDRQLQSKEEEAREALESLREDFREAVQFIRQDKTLAREEKVALIKQYSRLASKIEEQEEYDRQARERLEVAAGLGVVAGYMTHEAERLFSSLDDVIGQLAPLARRDSGVAETLKRIRGARDNLDGYLSYTRLYMDSLNVLAAKPFKARPQIDLVVERFGGVAARRRIHTEVAVAADLVAPAVPVALYSAVLLNLYTNAVKAIIARTAEGRALKVVIRAWNDDRQHHLEVCDTGVGIPPQLRGRVWDPFFTTTSAQNSPFGSGMGLGLPLVKSLLSRVRGTVEFAEPPSGFSTCVHVAVARGQSE